MKEVEKYRNSNKPKNSRKIQKFRNKKAEVPENPRK